MLHAAELTPANGNGVLRHFLPDRELRPDEPDGYMTRTELSRVREASEPLAHVEAAQREADDCARNARNSHEPSARAQLPALQDTIESLKAQHGPLRGAARAACIATLRAAQPRAAVKLMAAAALWADAAAEYVGLRQLEDEWLGTSNFDPHSHWQRCGLPAPSHGHLPKGRYVVSDAWGRDCAWTGSSPVHLENVRRVQAAFNAELQPALAGARLPF